MDAVTTEKFSEMVGVKSASIRAQYCVSGSYFGVFPRKLPNGRLMWDLKAIQELLQRAA